MNYTITNDILIASDIHGSYYFCEKLIKEFESHNYQYLVLLGDILYHGPRNDLPEGYAPKKVIELLNKHKDKIICVQGNCDAEVDQMVLNFKINPNYLVLEHIPSGRDLIITHGHHINEENMIEHKKGSILIHGHTHVSKCVEHDDYIFMNPGSVSIPKEGTPNGYISIIGKEVTWLDLNNNVYMKYEL